MFPLLSTVNNLFFMSVFYVIIISNLYQKRKEVSLQIYILYRKSNFQVYEGDISNYMQMYKSISRTLSILILVYILFLTPLSLYLLFEQEYKWPPQNKFFLYMGYIHDYGWSMHSEINISSISFVSELFGCLRQMLSSTWQPIQESERHTGLLWRTCGRRFSNRLIRLRLQI